MSTSTTASEKDNTWEQQIRELEAQALAAFFEVKLELLDQLWDAGFIVNSPLQKVVEKQQLFGLMRAGRIRHTSYRAEIERIARFGDTVIVMGNDRVTDPPDDTISLRRYTNVWQLQDGVWRTIARHAQVVSRHPPGTVLPPT